MARKQPTAAKAPISSESSLASDVFKHLQNAAACVKGEAEINISQKFKLFKTTIHMTELIFLPDFGIIQKHKEPSPHRTYRRWSPT